MMKSEMTEEAREKFLQDITDNDLPPMNRTQANYWRMKYLDAIQETRNANKGTRRLASNRFVVESRELHLTIHLLREKILELREARENCSERLKPLGRVCGLKDKP